MEGVMFFVGMITVVINTMLFWKVWDLCNNVNSMYDLLLGEGETLKKRFIDDVEALHQEIKDTDEFNKAVLELADRYYDKQTLKTVNFRAMIDNFHW